MLLLNQILLPFNKESKNYRIFNKESLDNINFRKVYHGELLINTYSSILPNIDDISHNIFNIRINNNLIGDVKILSTRKGIELVNLINSGYIFVFRPKMEGNTSEKHVKISEIISFDAIPLLKDPFFNIKEDRKAKIQHLNKQI